MEERYKSGLTITFDFGTVEESFNKEEPIYIYKDIGFEENNITMSVEEAEWLKSQLEVFITKLKDL